MSNPRIGVFSNKKQQQKKEKSTDAQKEKKRFFPPVFAAKLIYSPGRDVLSRFEREFA